MTINFALDLSDKEPAVTRVHRIPLVGWELYREHVYLYNVPAEFIGAWTTTQKREGEIREKITSYAVLKRFGEDYYSQLVDADERDKFFDLIERGQRHLSSELLEQISKHPDFVEGSPRPAALELIAEIEAIFPGYVQGATDRIKAHNEFMRGHPELMLFLAGEKDFVSSHIVPYSADIWGELAEKFSGAYMALIDKRFK